MAPKAKGGKGKGKTQGVVIDGVNTSEMTREQLEIFALRLKEELEREREERNFFQLDRDKVRTFWEITRNELDEARAEIRNKEKEIEISTEKNDEEIKNYRQKVKYLQYEHQNNIAELKADAMISLKAAQDAHTEQENELLRDKRELKKQLRNTENSNEEEIKALKMQQSEELNKAKLHFEELAKETEMKYEKKYEQLRQELHTKHTMEMNEVEERKSQQIANLIHNHEVAFTEVKNYYNDITLNNLALINSLKEQMEELTRQNERMVQQVAHVTGENKKLVEPLKQAQADVRELRRQLQNYEKDKLALANTKNKLTNCQNELEELKWLYNVLELRYEKLQTDREKLQQNFTQAILEVQQKTGLKNMLLQTKITSLQETIERKEVTLGELVAATKLQPHAVNWKLEELLKRKNTIIKDLQYELARVSKSHDDLLQTYESKLLSYGIPIEELGFTPLRILPYGQSNVAKGPAGLVTINK